MAHFEAGFRIIVGLARKVSGKGSQSSVYSVGRDVKVPPLLRIHWFSVPKELVPPHKKPIENRRSLYNAFD
jgi:hypothetical protein